MMARIEAEINGARYVVDSEAGPDRCAICDMPRRGKNCVWSMVCSNVLNGAVFKRVRQAEPTERDKGVAEYYEKNRFTGD